MILRWRVSWKKESSASEGLWLTSRLPLRTVLGMVQAFFNMANAGNNIDITLLSSGIYTAMITTVGGLIVGILAYFGYNYLVAQISNLMFMMENATIDFMDLLHEPAGNEEEK